MNYSLLLSFALVVSTFISVAQCTCDIDAADDLFDSIRKVIPPNNVAELKQYCRNQGKKLYKIPSLISDCITNKDVLDELKPIWQKIQMSASQCPTNSEAADFVKTLQCLAKTQADPAVILADNLFVAGTEFAATLPIGKKLPAFCASVSMFRAQAKSATKRVCPGTMLTTIEDSFALVCSSETIVEAELQKLGTPFNDKLRSLLESNKPVRNPHKSIVPSIIKIINNL